MSKLGDSSVTWGWGKNRIWTAGGCRLRKRL